MPKRKKVWRALLRLAVFCSIAYLSLVAMLIYREASLVYPAAFRPIDQRTDSYPGFIKQVLDVKPSPIHYWEHRAARRDAPVIFYFHGNGGLSSIPLSFFAQHKFHVIALSYPGYGSTPGMPSEPLIHAQAAALYKHIAEREPQRRRILWGYSLGSGIATHLAANEKADAVILEAPFTSLPEVGAEFYPYIPVRYIMKNRYPSRDLIARIHAPLLILHGDADTLIPIHHGRDLFALANQPKLLLEYHNYGHDDLAGSTAYEDAITFIHKHL